MQPAQPKPRPVPKSSKKNTDKRIYTTEDWEKLPEHPKYELIDGELVMFAAPSYEHQVFVATLCRLLGNALDGGPCEVSSGSAVRFIKTKNRIFIPDVVVVCDPKKPSTNYVVGAPDLVVEILSPSTASRDRILKLNAYKDEGVREYWIVDPFHKTVEVFFWEETIAAFVYGSADAMKVRIAEDAEIDLKKLFKSN
jgi:Uma2 family endonuclease